MKFVKKSEIRLNPANPRIIRDEKYRVLVRSVAQFPKMLDKRGIVVDGSKMILGGNQRWRAILDILKMPEAELTTLINGDSETFTRWEILREKQAVPENWIVDGSDMTDDEIRRFIIADNVEMGEHDWDMLANEWDADELADWGLDVPGFVGGGAGEAQEDDYEIPDEIETDIVAGDLFEIGPHRLLCGDSTKAEDVQKLLSGKEPYLMVTDPPYGIRLDTDYSRMGSTKTKYQPIQGDDNEFDLSNTLLAYSAKVQYIWGGDYFVNSINFLGGTPIIWAKRHSEEERKVFGSGFELLWVNQKTKRDIWFIRPINQSSERLGVHPTQKPVECMARPIANHDGDVYDPFLGSGTTMVAAHQLGRRCFGMEIDPKYCQVIVDRMLKLAPEIEIKKNGQPYEIDE